MTDDRCRDGAPADGPDGPDAEDRLRRRVLWTLPSGLYLLGSSAGGRRNLMTLSWATQLATRPRLVGVGVEEGALTHRLIADGGVFSLSVLRREDRPVVRRFVKPAEDDGRTLNGHPVGSAVTGAPILAAAAAWLDCELRHTLALGSHTLFVGEVVGAGFGAPGADAGGSGDGGADGTLGAVEGVEVLRMEDTRMSYGG